MAKNPKSAHIYANMTQTCKYFFFKLPIITLNYLRNSTEDHWVYEGVNGIQVWGTTRILPSKIWLASECNFNCVPCDTWNFPVTAKRASALSSKIYRSDLITLYMSFQGLLFNEFKILASSNTIKKLVLYETLIEYENGTVVPMEKIIENFPLLEDIYYYASRYENNPISNSITTETAANLLAIPHFSQLKSFTLADRPESFEIETFYKGLIVS